MSRERHKCTEDISGRFSRQDIEQSRVCAALAYVAFFIPLIIFPDDRYGRYHANQSLIMLLLSTIGVTLLSCIPYVGLLLALIVLVFCLVCFVRGVMLALGRKAKCIPFFGNIEIIVYEPKA